MTFSLVGRCARTGMMGMAIASSSPAVAARCAHARAGVGVVASQNVTNPALGPRGLDLMAAGASGPEAVAILARTDEHFAYRQILAIDRNGNSAIHSGPNALGIWAEAYGIDCATGGNLLANGDVPAAMAEAFERTDGSLGDRLIAVMQAGLAAGGEAGPVHSAGLLIVREMSWPIADLRIDWTEDCPIAALAAAWNVYEPQMEDYVARATDPTKAPSYGVPGDQ